MKSETWWAKTLLRAVLRLFDVTSTVEGESEIERGAILLLLRHASAGDTLLAATYVSDPHGFRLRYVLKQELQWDPCLDIVGHRLPNVFVDRQSSDASREIAHIQELARDLGPRDGVLIYPESTRFSEAKRRRVLERSEQAGDAKLLEYARSLRYVLPPRPGGTLGLLEAAPEADVVFCAHTGFEGAASLAQIWSGALLHRTIRIQFRRVARHEIPTDREARLDWLNEEWRRVGAWVERHQSPPGSAVQSGDASN